MPSNKIQSKMILSLLFALIALAYLDSQSGDSQQTEPASPTLASVLSAKETTEGQQTTAGIALDSIFNPRRAPSAKSMGLLQGNFLDAVKPARALQVAIVVDVTESMSAELASIRESVPRLLDDLARLTDANISTTIIAVTDFGSGEQPVSILHPTFLDDRKKIDDTLLQLQAGSGRPYFPEPVDLGIHRAIELLPWSTAPDVDKWIFFIGDAPPYDSNFSEPEKKAKRWFETQRLIDLANQRGIKVFCLLCKSREAERAAYEASLEKTRQFMSQLSTETGGLMLDLSYQQVREELLSRAGRQRASYAKVGYISQRDVEQLRGGEQHDAGGRLRIAVLPLLSFPEMTFYFERPEVQIATQLRQLLQDVGNLRIVSPRELEQELLRLKTESIPESQWPQAICLRLRADYLVSGTMRGNERRQDAVLNVHGPDSQDPLVTLGVGASREQLSRAIFSQLATAENPAAEYLMFQKRVAKYLGDSGLETIGAGMFGELSATGQAELFAAIEALEQSLSYPAGDLEARKMLDAAEQKLVAFVGGNPRHAFGHSILASCRYNQAKLLETLGQQDDAKAKFKAAQQSLDEAYLLRKTVGDEISQWEIQADYHLLVRQDWKQAIDFYEQIVKRNETSPAGHALHAHWMLAGIRAGDWGAEEKSPDVLDVEKCRQHLMRILAWWPESIEAETIRTALRWNEKSEMNQSPWFPREGNLLLTRD
jgi:hypothetical protein